VHLAKDLIYHKANAAFEDKSLANEILGNLKDQAAIVKKERDEENK